MWTRTRYLWVAGELCGPMKTRTASIEPIGDKYRLSCFPILGNPKYPIWSGPVSIHETLGAAKQCGAEWINLS